MQLSTFNLYVEDQPEPGKTLVYNTFTGAFVVLDPAELAALRKADAGESLTDAEQALCLEEYADDSVGILVASHAAEEQAFSTWYEEMRSDPERLDVLVSTTFACNMACTYCCQDDVLSGKVMQEETAGQTAAWIADRAIEVGAREVRLSFVGGEPLLQPQRVGLIARSVQAALRGRVPFSFTVITNGVFLTPDLVESWLPLGLKAAQVTLDGDESTHSITRRSRTGEDLFAVIFENVARAAQRIAITIRGNYQADTVHGFVPLLAKLRGVGLPAGSKVRFTPAVANLGAPSDSAAGSCTWSGSRPEWMVPLSDAIRHAGFAPGPLLEIGPCGFHLRHHLAVDPDGHIYKCPGFLGHADWAVGHVATGLTARYEGLLGLRPHRECGSCVHLPACGGGCVATQYVKSGRAEGINCELGYFEGQKDQALIRMYLLEALDNEQLAITRFPAPSAQVPLTPSRCSAALPVLAA